MIQAGSPAAVLSCIAGGGMIVLGAFGFALPGLLAGIFGLPVTDRDGLGFARAAAARDVAIGAVMLGAALYGNSPALLIALAASLLVSVLDACTVYYANGRRVIPQHLLHFGGVALFAVILALAVHDVLLR